MHPQSFDNNCHMKQLALTAVEVFKEFYEHACDSYPMPPSLLYFGRAKGYHHHHLYIKGGEILPCLPWA